MRVFNSLNLRADVRHNLVKLRVVVVGFGPLNTTVTNDHVTLAFAGVMVTDLDRGMFEFTATPV